MNRMYVVSELSLVDEHELLLVACTAQTITDVIGVSLVDSEKI